MAEKNKELSGIVGHMMDLATEYRANAQVRLIIQLLIGLNKLKKKGIKGIDVLMTEILTTLGQSQYFVSASDLQNRTVDELAISLLKQKQTSHDDTDKKDAESVVLQDTEIEKIVNSLLSDYGIKTDDIHSAHAEMIATYFGEKMLNGVAIKELYSGGHISAMRQHLETIYIGDTTDRSQMFYCLSQNRSTSYVGVDLATYMHFGTNYIADKYQKLYGKEYKGPTDSDLALHEDFFNVSMVQLFPTAQRTKEDEQLIKELLVIEQMTDDAIKIQILTREPTRVDLARERNRLRESKLRELLGISVEAPLTSKYKELLENLADSKDLSDRLRDFAQQKEYKGAEADKERLEEKGWDDYFAKEYVKHQIRTIEARAASYADKGTVWKQQLQQELLRSSNGRKIHKPPTEEERSFARKSRDLSIIEAYGERSISPLSDTMHQDIQQRADELDLQIKLRDHYVELVNKASQNEIELLAFHFNISLQEAQTRKKELLRKIAIDPKLTARTIEENSTLTKELIAKDPALNLAMVKEGFLLDKLVLTIDGEEIIVETEKDPAKIRQINMQAKDLFVREIIKKQLDGKSVSTVGESIDTQLPFFRDDSSLQAYESNFGDKMQAYFLEALETDPKMRQAVMDGMYRQGVLEPGTDVPGQEFADRNARLLNEKRQELYRELLRINEAVKKATMTEEEGRAAIIALVKENSTLEIETKFNAIAIVWEQEIMSKLKSGELVLPEQLQEYMHGVSHALTYIQSSSAFIASMESINSLVLGREAGVDKKDVTELENNFTYKTLRSVLHKAGLDKAFITDIDADLTYMERMTSSLDDLEEDVGHDSKQKQVVPEKVEGNMVEHIQIIKTPFGIIPISTSVDFDPKDDALKFVDANVSVQGGGTVQVDVANRILPALFGGRATSNLQWAVKKIFDTPDFTDQNVGDIINDLAKKYLDEGKLNIELSTFESLQVMHDVLLKLKIPKGVDKSLDKGVADLHAAYDVWLKNSATLKQKVVELQGLVAEAGSAVPDRHARMEALKIEIDRMRQENLATAQKAIVAFTIIQPPRMKDKTLTRVLWQIKAQADALHSAKSKHQKIASLYEHVIKEKASIVPPVSFVSQIDRIKKQKHILAEKIRKAEEPTSEEIKVFGETVTDFVDSMGEKLKGWFKEKANSQINLRLEDAAKDSSLINHLEMLKKINTELGSRTVAISAEKFPEATVEKIKQITIRNPTPGWKDRLGRAFSDAGKHIRQFFIRMRNLTFTRNLLSPEATIKQVADPPQKYALPSESISDDAATEAYQRNVNRKILKLEQLMINIDELTTKTHTDITGQNAASYIRDKALVEADIKKMSGLVQERDALLSEIDKVIKEGKKEPTLLSTLETQTWQEFTASLRKRITIQEERHQADLVLGIAYTHAINGEQEELLDLIRTQLALQKNARIAEFMELGAVGNKLELIEALHNAYPDVTLNSALLFAAGAGNIAAYQELVLLGADVNSVDADGNNALHLAISNQKPEMVRQLIHDGVDVNKRNNHGDAPLHIAASIGNIECTSALMQAIALKIKMKDSTGRTALERVNLGDLAVTIKSILTVYKRNNSSIFPYVPKATILRVVSNWYDNDKDKVLDPIVDCYRYYASRVDNAMEQIQKLQKITSEFKNPPSVADNQIKLENQKKIKFLKESIIVAKEYLASEIKKLAIEKMDRPERRETLLTELKIKCQKFDADCSVDRILSELEQQNRTSVELHADHIKDAEELTHKFDQCKAEFTANYQKLAEINMSDLQTFKGNYAQYMETCRACITISEQMAKIKEKILLDGTQFGLLSETIQYHSQAIQLGSLIENNITTEIEQLQKDIITPIQARSLGYEEINELINEIDKKNLYFEAKIAALKERSAFFSSLIEQHTAMPREEAETIHFYIKQATAVATEIAEMTHKLQALQAKVDATEPRKSIITSLQTNFTIAANQYTVKLKELHDKHAKFKLYEAIYILNTKEIGYFIAQPDITTAMITEAIFYAVEHNKHGVLKALFYKEDIDINATNEDGKTLLQVAVELGHSKTIEKLIDLGADPFVKDLEGRIPKEVAATKDLDYGSVCAGREEYKDSKLAVVEKKWWDNDYYKIVNIRKEIQYYEKQFDEISKVLAEPSSNKQELKERLMHLKQSLDSRLAKIPEEYLSTTAPSCNQVDNKDRCQGYFDDFRSSIIKSYFELQQKLDSTTTQRFII